MKKPFKLALIFVFALFASSCINNKRIVYVQDHSQPRSHMHLSDTTFENPPDDYRIKAGDILHFKSDHPILSQSFQQLDNSFLSETRVLQMVPALAGFTVDETGSIKLPIIGMVHIEDLTIFEATQKITFEASKVFDDPAIRVFLLNYYITVLGEVNTPGRHQIFNHRINIFEAMGLANDATDFADRESVKIIRSRDGKNHLTHIDLTDQDILNSPYFYLHPNDVLLVKPQRRKKFATRDVQNVFNALSIAISAITLYLLIAN